MNFNAIKVGVAAQFERIQQYPLFRVQVDKDELWNTYLASFPPGTNPIYRERTEHDCSGCKHFIRTIGSVVAIVDGEVVSLWDVAEAALADEPAYTAVAAAMSALVKSKPIAEPFVHYEKSVGVDRNFEQVAAARAGVQTGKIDFTEALATVKTWTHFFVNLDSRFVKAKAAIPTTLSEARSTHDVFLRSLREISNDAIDTVLDLIGQNSLYRGEEHRELVWQFGLLKEQFDRLADEGDQDIFAWTGGTSLGPGWGAVSRIRNTVIGTLLTDLSDGVDLEAAVRSFEAKVAPTNYKRPTALVTKAMIEKAKEKLTELGLMSALDRRYATVRDISVADILFADRSARKAINGDVFDELASTVDSRAAGKSKHLDKVEEVSIDRFVAEILPRAESVEVMFENRHQGNLVSLIAPCDPTARRLFKWDNGFSWSYNGEVADAIKERVKKAGGNVTGDLCCRLAWFNRDDLDLHMVEPTRYEISFMNRGLISPSGGRLDVDMNVRGETREPVENIFYQRQHNMREGEYLLFVHQYTRREADDIGFEVEIDYLGDVHKFGYEKAIRQGEKITVAHFRYTHKGGLEIIDSLPASQTTRTVWGLATQTFHRVTLLTMSPNHWGDNPSRIGNKHYFFMIGAKNDGTARGFFNEFLREDLTPYRKVLEMVGSKIKAASEAGEAGEQLSGLGFSSTRHDTVICRVRGSFTRTVKVVF